MSLFLLNPKFLEQSQGFLPQYQDNTKIFGGNPKVFTVNPKVFWGISRFSVPKSRFSSKLWQKNFHQMSHSVTAII
jgi:hypothetical protein